MAKTVHDFSCATTGGKKKSLADYKGKVPVSYTHLTLPTSDLV